MIPPSIKKQALKLLGQGNSVKEVSAKLELSKRTVYSWVERKPKNNVIRRVGRPRKIPPRRV